jgi:hypothetical protein
MPTLNKMNLKNTCSLVLATRLLSAGFKQPEPSIGQFWANPNGGITCVGFGATGKPCVKMVGLNYVANKTAIYLPTMEDIMVGFSDIHGGMIDVGPRPGLGLNGEMQFCCKENWGTQVDIRETMHEIEANPHDAAALVYLAFAEAKVFKSGNAVVFREGQETKMLAFKQMVEDGESVGGALAEVNFKDQVFRLRQFQR